MSEEVTFPDSHLEYVKAAYEMGKAKGVLGYISAFETIEERRALYGLARKMLSRADSVNLDDVITIAEAAIADCMEASSATDETDLSNKIKDYANVFSYNLAADLAECWPEDGTPRTKHHFEVGLAAAENCLMWRHELKKGPWPFSVAWWAKGAHQLSLGRAADAVQSFQQSYHHAELVAAGSNADINTDFGCLLAEGYLGLAEERAGTTEGAQRFESAIARFETVAAGDPGEAADDARFGISQLKTMQSRLSARVSPPL